MASLSLALALAGVAACSSSSTDTASGGGGSTSGTGGGSSASCWQADTMLDVSKAPGAGDGYDKPKVTASCTDSTFVVDSNGMPTYTFVQTTPNPLTAQTLHWEIPREPKVADQTTPVPLLGLAGFAVNGLPFFGPNEGAQPAESAYGDPVYNGLMDPCLGHTAFEYHYHSFLVKCLVDSGLVAEPWMNADPPADEASPIIGWAMDGFPIYGPQECTDSSCAKVVTMQSGYEKIGDPTTYAWKAYAWKAHDGDATYLDECNGHVGPSGDYHYHATSGFPYIIGCYRGTPMGIGNDVPGGGAGGGGQGGTGGGGMGGPKSCTSDADCTNACPPGSAGCACNQGPNGQICVPTCSTDADCPQGPNGETLTCKQGICAP